jgi:hypothetical protein
MTEAGGRNLMSDTTMRDVRSERERREREATGLRVVWLDEPKPLFERSKINVWGVTTDAEPHLMSTYSAYAQPGQSSDGG